MRSRLLRDEIFLKRGDWRKFFRDRLKGRVIKFKSDDEEKIWKELSENGQLIRKRFGWRIRRGLLIVKYVMRIVVWGVLVVFSRIMSWRMMLWGKIFDFIEREIDRWRNE